MFSDPLRKERKKGKKREKRCKIGREGKHKLQSGGRSLPVAEETSRDAVTL